MKRAVIDDIGIDRLLSTRTVCDLLDVSDRNLRRLVASGRFPKPDLVLGRALKWRKSTVVGAIEQGGSVT